MTSMPPDDLPPHDDDAVEPGAPPSADRWAPPESGSPWAAPPGGASDTTAPQGAIVPPGDLPLPPAATPSPFQQPELPPPPTSWVTPPSQPYPTPPPPQAPQPPYAAPQYGAPQAPPPSGFAPASYQTYDTRIHYGPTDFAGFFSRFATWFVDGIVVGGLPSIIYYGALFAAPTEQRICRGASGYTVCEQPDMAWVAPFAIVAFVLLIIMWVVFYLRPLGTTGQTFAGRRIGVRLVDATTGAPIGMGRVFGRQLMALVSGWCCYLGYFWMLFQPKKQTWQDLATNSVVIRV